MTNPSTFRINANLLLTMPRDSDALAHYDPSRIADRDYEITGAIEDATLVVVNGDIIYAGPSSDAPKSKGPSFSTDICMPGWIDCHTHTVFAGDRAEEFVLRNAGRPYAEILESGGGILNTVDAVRQTSKKVLSQTLYDRVLESVRNGVTHLEIKSGYGLSVAEEGKLLKAIQSISEDVPCELIPCFLGAHAIPRNFKDDREKYISIVIEEMIPQFAEQDLAGYCDVFCDRGAFTSEESLRILKAGKKAGMIPRIHADELSNAGGAAVAVEVGASSADHLEFTPPEMFAELAKADVAAVLMPAVNLFLGTTNALPDARGLLNAGCEVAVATDFNPGSAMTQNLPLMLSLACTLYKMTPGEVLRSVTVGAAKALGRSDIGSLEVGARANLTLLSGRTMANIPYHFGTSHLDAVIYNGEFVYWTNVEDEA